MLSQGLGVLPSWLCFPFTANSRWEIAHRAGLLAKLREPARGAYVFRIPEDVGGGGTRREEGRRGWMRRDTSSGSHPECGGARQARPGRCSQPSPRYPRCQVMDAEQKGKPQEQGKALRLRFAVKGRQPRACGWAEPEEGCKGAGPA